MRIAIISDIHGNLEALNSAFEFIQQSNVDEVVCLGDVVGYGANPNECLELVRKRCSFILKGNHDAAAVDLSVAESFTANARTSAHWTNNALTEENKQILRSLPFTQERQSVFFVHASPCSPEDWDYILSDWDARVAFRCFSQPICFLGHTHAPAVFSHTGRSKAVRKDEQHIVNVGSVGQPRDGNPKLSFGLFDTEKWEYENIRGEYDIELAAKKIVAAGLPEMLADRLWMGV